MEKLADGLQRLGEDDLLQVVQMVHDNKTSETYTKNDVESKLFIKPFFFLLPELATLSVIFGRRRVPRGSLHSSGQPRQDALGIYGYEDGIVKNRGWSDLKLNKKRREKGRRKKEKESFFASAKSSHDRLIPPAVKHPPIIKTQRMRDVP